MKGWASAQADASEGAAAPALEEDKFTGWLRRKKESHGIFEDPYKMVGDLSQII